MSRVKVVKQKGSKTGTRVSTTSKPKTQADLQNVLNEGEAARAAKRRRIDAKNGTCAPAPSTSTPKPMEDLATTIAHDVAANSLASQLGREIQARTEAEKEEDEEIMKMLIEDVVKQEKDVKSKTEENLDRKPSEAALLSLSTEITKATSSERASSAR